jgi:hypothetical protein
VTEHSLFYFAALASSAWPELSITAVQPLEYGNATEDADTSLDSDIESAVILDARGKEYDISLGKNEEASHLLSQRFAAAQTFSKRADRTFRYPVEDVIDLHENLLIAHHLTGSLTPFSQMDSEQLSEIGTAIGSLHRTDEEFLDDTTYPYFDAPMLLAGIEQWLGYLSKGAEVPQTIVTRWTQICSVESLWNFKPSVIHGGFRADDFLFNRHRISAVRHWESLQISDPARDVAWVYSSGLSEEQQDDVLSAYGRKMGSLMDSRIIPRARMWSQMEIVKTLLAAMKDHDAEAIRSARVRVEELARKLAPVTRPQPAQGTQTGASRDEERSSTLTVGNLLDSSSALNTTGATDATGATEILHDVQSSGASEYEDDDRTIESRSYGN